MFKLLVDTPKGIQEIIEVESTGDYYDPSRVVFDERKHGWMNVSLVLSQMGAWKMENGVLIQDASKKSAHDAVVAEIVAAKADLLKKDADRKSLIKSIKSAGTLDELKSVLTALVEHLGLD